MLFLRMSSNPWGQETVAGASWDLLWWFIGAAVLFIVLHALGRTLVRRNRDQTAEPRAQGISK